MTEQISKFKKGQKEYNIKKGKESYVIYRNFWFKGYCPYKISKYVPKIDLLSQGHSMT